MTQLTLRHPQTGQVMAKIDEASGTVVVSQAWEQRRRPLVQPEVPTPARLTHSLHPLTRLTIRSLRSNQFQGNVPV